MIFVRLDNKYSYQNYFAMVENILIYIKFTIIYIQSVYLHRGRRWLWIVVILYTFILIYCTVIWFYVLRQLHKNVASELLNKSWRQHPTRHQLYGHLPPHHENYTS